ncbi:MAG: HAD family phosphatase [Sedimentisphaerales bacterium]|nr:HAD family phosphatase [Sedimentisphaerales bacterium]
MGKIEAIIFDWGGVLIEDPAPGLVRYCAHALGVSEDKYQSAYRICMNDFETGKITERQFWMNLTDRLKVPVPTTDSLWGAALSSVYVPRRELFSLANHLRNAGCKTAILSNTEKPAVEFFKKQKYDVFDVTVFSCLEGIMKPQREIYELILARLGTSAERTLFVDDKQEYIDGAKHVGLNTILFRNVEKFYKDLNRFRPDG